jgi:serine/threonine protein kinase
MKNMFDSKKNKFSYSEALSIFKDIYKGYKYLFMSGYIHRNIDPSNILIKNGEYKISDFGMASKELDLPLKVDEYIPISPYKSP